jgi:hypothetical protein
MRGASGTRCSDHLDGERASTFPQRLWDCGERIAIRPTRHFFQKAEKLENERQCVMRVPLQSRLIEHPGLR